ncbi:MAG: hypothetical protein EOS57_26100 [Mesorhizobium sp.]|uniref:DUF5691 domain-containing protein n=1 Tax=Mesorhizobium sp. TaxID=1871066 RepID=UPI000FE9C2E9|nr:DUF5691 domain-containing protein [Mesorhizobium sp.]RWB31782.1 MAG: hypothetical protein EOQ43_11560 [Mesorhizobium sp.]RWD04356.1 MAG: hypothetical protein EOS57_26100 [Mesorhizobium sp.]RWE70693.1 MAG: hypothetical protein EOS62_01245 [Mesorhizobium sp.]RWF56217.1 MAG: hypothetical protein EOS50_11005 [Mesorhizobium sp.]
MNESEQTGLATMRDCWITGGATFDLAPTDWKTIAGDASPDEQERRLLAIAAQALDVALRPAAPKMLKRRPPLPRLALPMLPERLRPLLRAALKHAVDARRKTRVVTLVASRGFVLHPMDWMPSDQNSPDVYAPWIDWQASFDGERHAPLEKLTAGNWDEFYPAARRMALADMRRSEPASARMLVEAKASGEPAEVRLALIELMRFGLNPEDAPFLKSLSADRSGKVRELAGRLLARLGEHGHSSEGWADGPAAELAAFISEGKSGFIRRRSIYTPAKLKSPAQEKRRAELFETCNLVDLAARFGTTEPEFIGAWQFGADHNADILIAQMVAASGSDAAVTHMADTLVADGGKPALFVLHLMSRLDSRRKRAVVRLILKDSKYLGALNVAEGIEASWLEWGDLTNGQTLLALRSAVAGNDDAVKRGVDDILESLGFLATATTAAKLIDEVVAAGIPPAAPSLSVLRLNAALAEHQSRTDT